MVGNAHDELWTKAQCLLEGLAQLQSNKELQLAVRVWPNRCDSLMRTAIMCRRQLGRGASGGRRQVRVL